MSNKPLWKQKKVFIPTLLVLAIAIGSSGGGDKTQKTTNAADTKAQSKPAPVKAAPVQAAPAKPALVVSAKELIAVLEGNALKAKNTYEDQQVTVTGYVGNIDASGKYFALDPSPDAIIFTGIQVKTGDEFKDQVANFSKGQAVTVTGKITNVGEVLGYSLEAETIK